MLKKPIGIIAGGGQFPILCADAVRARGMSVVAVAHKGEAAAELEEHADVVYWIKLGQLGKIIKYFKKENVREALFLGTITKTKIFRDVLPDLKGLTLWNRIDTRQDDAILRAVAAELERENIHVLASTEFLSHLLFPDGVLSERKPTASEMEDIRFGWRIAKEIGRLDIGQCVVVRDRTVLAVEAMEGTDAAIRRGGRLAASGAVVVKVKKPQQDFRFDLPAIGTATIETLAAAGGAVLAVEAGQSLIFDRKTMIAAADRTGIAVIGIKENENGSLNIPI